MTRPAPRTIDEHVAAALARVAPLEELELPLADAASLGLVVSRDVIAPAPVPAFDNSAMDGYAVRLADLPEDGTEVTLPVLDDVRPGPLVASTRASVPATPPPVAVGMKSTRLDRSNLVDFIPTATGEPGVVRIMTGAALPGGYDAVVPVERTSTGRFVAGGPTAERTVTLARQHRDHVRRAGTDIAAGDTLSGAGAAVTPGLVAAAAAAGLTSLPVHRRPRIAVISTGSELADLGSTAPGTIPDSNSLMLAALARAAGADVVRVGAVPDDADALGTALDTVVGAQHGQAAQRPVDLIVTSGGVSAGASDVVREVLAAGAAADVDLSTVAMRPGKPQALATWHGVPWIAVPGNPVSAFVSFALYARPALRRLAGRHGSAPMHTARAAASWSSTPGTEQVVPVTTGADGVTPSAHDGHHLSGLPAADALAIVPAGTDHVGVGDQVRVLPLDGVLP